MFTFRAMDAYKLRSFFIHASILTFSHTLLAQDGFLGKEIRIKPGTFRLDSLLITITQQTGVVFSYNAKKFDSKRRINISSGIRTLGVFLDALKKEKGLAIKMIENYVVITSATKEPPQKAIQPPLTTVVKPTEIIKRDEGFSRSSNPTIKKDSVLTSSVDSTQALVEKKVTLPVEKKQGAPNDTLTQKPKFERSVAQRDSVKSTPKSPLPKKPEADSVKKNPAIIAKPVASNNSVKKSLFSIKKSLFVKTGATVDESSFMGVVVQCGLPIAYATLAANSNLLATHIRYGVGSSYKVSSSVRIHFAISYGNISRSGFFSDTLGIKYPIAVKSNLLRVGLGAEFRLKNRLSLQVIPTVNQLTTNYFINHVSSNLSLFNNAGDDLFYTIKPPYLISNTFSPDASSNVKMWIGVQLNFLYRLNFY